MKKIILNTIDDLASDFLYYDRKEDDELSASDLKNAVNTGVITIEEMVEAFKTHLTNSLID